MTPAVRNDLQVRVAVIGEHLASQRRELLAALGRTVPDDRIAHLLIATLEQLAELAEIVRQMAGEMPVVDTRCVALQAIGQGGHVTNCRCTRGG